MAAVGETTSGNASTEAREPVSTVRRYKLGTDVEGFGDALLHTAAGQPDIKSKVVRLDTFQALNFVEANFRMESFGSVQFTRPTPEGIATVAMYRGVSSDSPARACALEFVKVFKFLLWKVQSCCGKSQC